LSFVEKIIKQWRETGDVLVSLFIRAGKKGYEKV